MLEPCEGRLSRTVLRGLGAINGPWLPDWRAEFEACLVVVVALCSGARRKPAWRLSSMPFGGES